jgi:hypothetical protein
MLKLPTNNKKKTKIVRIICTLFQQYGTCYYIPITYIFALKINYYTPSEGKWSELICH